MSGNLVLNSLYLHFPFCRHLCNYCDFYKKIPASESDYSTFENLLTQMFKSNEQLLITNDYRWDSLETLYIGGGTPSLWGERGAEFLSQKFKEYAIALAPNCEFTLEVNPGSWSEAGLNAWREFGVNRFSLGIQSLNSNFIKLLDRVHNIDDVYATLEKFKSLDVNFSVDFMLGLPYSEKYNRNIADELNEILQYKPDHLSLYILTTKENYIHKDHLPDDEFVEYEYLLVSKILKEHGYIHYEVSNFAKPNKMSKHNLRYWQMNPVAALGPSATGFLPEAHLRYKWKVNSPAYTEEKLSDDEIFLEKIYMSLRNYNGLALNVFTDSDRSEKLLEIANSWEKRSLAKIENQSIILESKGFLILDFLMDELFNQIKF